MGCPAILWQRIGGKAWRWSLTENRKPLPPVTAVSGSSPSAPEISGGIRPVLLRFWNQRRRLPICGRKSWCRSTPGKREESQRIPLPWRTSGRKSRRKPNGSSFAKNRRRRDVYPLGMRRAAWCVVQAWGFPKRQFQRRQAPPLFTFMGKPTKPSRKTLPWRGHTGRS